MILCPCLSSKPDCFIATFPACSAKGTDCTMYYVVSTASAELSTGVFHVTGDCHQLVFHSARNCFRHHQSASTSASSSSRATYHFRSSSLLALCISLNMDEEAALANKEANLKETIRFWRAWRTAHQMCRDRVCDTRPSSLAQSCANEHHHACASQTSAGVSATRAC